MSAEYQLAKRITQHFLLIAIAVALLLPVSNVARANEDQTKPANINDVRILIDISGSMKKNDPENLRQPALKLFLSLLPSEALSGVWTFGQWVNMLIPHGQVSEKWKSNARKSIKSINSAGLYTNIEDALRRSTWDWTNTDEKSKRSLILLTDGLVDISKDDDKNALSRQRILQELLPRLQKANVTINAIALSEDSDSNLLEQLTSATGGRFETIKTSKGLERIFLHLFENVAPRDSLPLKNNRVKVDGSINEITFLVFNNKKQSESSITSPAGKTYDINNLKKEMTWHKEKNYDLVTIKKPKPGYWKINAPTDPDNRVLVVTDLKLVSTKLPNTLSVGDKQIFRIHLEENGKLINRRDFLFFVKATLNQSTIDENNKEKTWKLKLLDNGKGSDDKSKDGVYSAILDKSLIPGEHDIEVVINGTTFRRYNRQKINIYRYPVSANIEEISESEFKVSILPYKKLIDPNAMRVTAEHKTPDGNISNTTISRVSPAEWMAKFPTNENTGKHEITINVLGNSHEGNPINVTLPPLTIMFGESTKTQEPDKVPEDNKADSQEPIDINTDTVNWIYVSLKLLTFNILTILFIFLTYKFWPSIRRLIIPNLLEETEHG